MFSRRLILACLLLTATTALAIPLPSDSEKWLELKIDGFHIISNASEKTTRQVARDLQMMRAVVSKISDLNVRAPLTTKVYIFRDSASFAPYRDAAFGRTAKNMAGVFLAHSDGNYIAIDTLAQSDGIVYHELTHYFLNNSSASIPLWLNEGLAEFYSTFYTLGDAAIIGKPVEPHVRALRVYRLIPMRELLTVTRESKDYNEGHRQGVYYAQSWALTHYLLVGNSQGKTQLKTFTRLLSEGKSVDESFKESFGLSLERFEGELKRYVRSRRFLYTSYDFGELPRVAVPPPSPMPRAEVLFQLGDLLAHASTKGSPDCEELLLAALSVNPNHAAANATLASVLDRRGRSSEAAKLYDRALASEELDSSALLLAAEHLMDRAFVAQPTSHSLVERARVLFEKAVALNEEAPRAWAGLGSTYLFEDQPGKGISALEKSWSLAPTQMDVAHNLVALYARNGQREKAVEMIDGVLAKSSDERILASAREALLVADVKAAEALLRQGKFAEAEKVLTEVKAATTNSELKVAIEGQLERIRTFSDHSRFINLYNDAVIKANKQDFKGALLLLDELIASSSADESIVSAAKDLQAEIGKFTKK